MPQGIVPLSAPLLFTAKDCLDIGIASFNFNGTIRQLQAKYLD